MANQLINGINYSLDDTNHNASVIKLGSGTYTGVITIPSSVIYNSVTYSVTSIGGNAFSNCNGLTSVTIPNSVTSIGNYAFDSCIGLISVTIPNSVITIGVGAFQRCSSLTSVTIGNSVTTIGEMAFLNCNGLTSIIIPNSVTSIGNYAFDSCIGLISVTIPNSVITIGVGAFQHCSSLTSVTIGNSVTTIGNYTFKGCSRLTSITIPNSVTTIGNETFYGCGGLTSIIIPNSVTSIGNYAFDSCIGLISVTIPNSVITIGKYTFNGCSGLTSVTIGNSVTSIGNYAFDSCIGLISVTIPNSVITIGKYTFNGCSGLTSVTIGNSVTSIGISAFYGCYGLTSINVDSGNNNYSSLDGVLYNKLQNILIWYPAGKQGVFTIPNSVTSIGSYAFQGCTGLTSITIPNSVTTIGGNAFQNCSSLTSVIIKSVNLTNTTLNSTAFDNVNGTFYVPLESYKIFSALSGKTVLVISQLLPYKSTTIGYYIGTYVQYLMYDYLFTDSIFICTDNNKIFLKGYEIFNNIYTKGNFITLPSATEIGNTLDLPLDSNTVFLFKINGSTEYTLTFSNLISYGVIGQQYRIYLYNFGTALSTIRIIGINEKVLNINIGTYTLFAFTKVTSDTFLIDYSVIN